MMDIPQIIPQEGKPGMTVADLVFHKHQMAYGAEVMEEALKGIPPDMQKFMASWITAVKTTKHAVVKFPNGATISVITGVPEPYGDSTETLGFSAAMLARADERYPSYEIAFSSPGGEEAIRNYQTTDEVNQILSKLAGA